MTSRWLTLKLLATVFMLWPVAGRADEPFAVELTLKEHKFEPAEVKIPSGKAIAIRLSNQDQTPEEFDSPDLRVEKVVTPKGTVTIKLKPLAAGRYRFSGEYNSNTAQGVLIVE